MFNARRQSQQPVPFSAYLADERCISAISSNLQAFLLSCEAGQPDYQCWHFVFDKLPVEVVEEICRAQDSELVKQFELAIESMKSVLPLREADQLDMSAMIKKVTTREFNGWAEIALTHACYELFENKGELKPGIKKVLRKAGVDNQLLIEINPEIKWAILCSYLMNILYSPATTDDHENDSVNLQHILLFSLQNFVAANRKLVETLKFVGISKGHANRLRNKRLLGDSLYDLIENDICEIHSIVNPVISSYGEQGEKSAKEIVATVLKEDLSKCLRHVTEVLYEVLNSEYLIEHALNDYNFLDAGCEYRSILAYIHSRQFNPQKDLTINYHRIKEVLVSVFYAENGLSVGGLIIEDDAPIVFDDKLRDGFILGAVIASLTNWYFTHLSHPGFTELERYVLGNVVQKNIDMALKNSFKHSMGLLGQVTDRIRLNKVRDDFLGLGLLVFVAKKTAFNAGKNLSIRHSGDHPPFMLLTDRKIESSRDTIVNSLLIEDFKGYFSTEVSEFINSLPRAERDAIADIYRVLYYHYRRQGEDRLVNFISLIYRITRKEVENALSNIQSNIVIKQFIDALNALALIDCDNESLQKRKDAYILNLLGSLSGYECALPVDAIFIQLTKICKDNADALRAELLEDNTLALVGMVRQQAQNSPLGESHLSGSASDDDVLWEPVDLDPSVDQPQESPVESGDTVSQQGLHSPQSFFKKWLPTILITAAIVIGLAALIVGGIFTAGVILVPAVIATKIAISCFVVGGVLTLGGTFLGSIVISQSFAQRSNSDGDGYQSTDARVRAVLPAGSGGNTEDSEATLTQETPDNSQVTVHVTGQAPSLDPDLERRFNF